MIFNKKRCVFVGVFLLVPGVCSGISKNTTGEFMLRFVHDSQLSYDEFIEYLVSGEAQENVKEAASLVIDKQNLGFEAFLRISGEMISFGLLLDSFFWSATELIKFMVRISPGTHSKRT